MTVTVAILLLLASIASTAFAIRLAHVGLHGSMVGALRCAWRGVCRPLHALALQAGEASGSCFRCEDCLVAHESLGDFFGYEPTSGYVAPVRRVFDRQDGGSTRTSAWDPLEAGPRKGRW